MQDLTVCLGYYNTDNIPTIANLTEVLINDKDINAKKVILHHEDDEKEEYYTGNNDKTTFGIKFLYQ